MWAPMRIEKAYIMNGVYCALSAKPDGNFEKMEQELGRGGYGRVVCISHRQAEKRISTSESNYFAIEACLLKHLNRIPDPNVLRVTPTWRQTPPHWDGEGMFFAPQYCRNKPICPETAANLIGQAAMGLLHLKGMSVLHAAEALEHAHHVGESSARSSRRLWRLCGSVARRTSFLYATTLWCGRRRFSWCAKLQDGVWGLGVTHWELLLGECPFSEVTEWGMLVSLFRARGTPSEASWRGVSSLPKYRRAFLAFLPSR